MEASTRKRFTKAILSRNPSEPHPVFDGVDQGKIVAQPLVAPEGLADQLLRQPVAEHRLG